jgi:hypothetical protein
VEAKPTFSPLTRQGRAGINFQITDNPTGTDVAPWLHIHDRGAFRPVALEVIHLLTGALSSMMVSKPCPRLFA